MITTIAGSLPIVKEPSQFAIRMLHGGMKWLFLFFVPAIASASVPTTIRETYGQWKGGEFRCLVSPGDISEPQDEITLEITSYENGSWVKSPVYGTIFRGHELKRIAPDHQSLHLTLTIRGDGFRTVWFQAIFAGKNGELFGTRYRNSQWSLSNEPEGTFKHGLLKVQDEHGAHKLELDFFTSPLSVRYENTVTDLLGKQSVRVCRAKVSYVDARD